MSKHALVVLFIAAVTLIGVSSPANASVVVASGSSAPSDDILTYYSVGYDNFAWPSRWISDSGYYGHLDIAQSFLVTGDYDWVLDAVTVKVREFGTSVANQPFHLQMWTVSNAADYSGDSLVSDQSGVYPSSGLTSGYWTFDLNDVVLTSGQYYAFVLGFQSGPDTQRFVDLVNDYSGGGIYPDGRMFGRVGTPLAWTTLGNSSNGDFDFYVQGVPVPEPASLSLSVLALSGLALLHRRKAFCK